MKDENIHLRENNLTVSVEKMLKGGYLAQVFALFFDIDEHPDRFNWCNKMAERFHNEMEKNKDKIAIAKNYDDIIKNKNDNKMSAILSIEEGGALEGKIENLKHFYDLGVRLITLTWNYKNEIGYPHCYKETTKNEIDNQHCYKNITKNEIDYQDCYKETTKNNIIKTSSLGLTEFGVEVVQNMQNLGMIVDVSHLNDEGFQDVYELSQKSNKPFVASHSNARSITNHSRNLSDDMIKKLAQTGGVMGINFSSDFLKENEEDYTKIEYMIEHINHIKKIGGIDVIALGSDFDGIDSEVEIKDASQMMKLYDALKKEKYTEEEIEKIAYKNALRVIKDTL
jgi:membrane dipeptidase